jgi:nucleotide-binding universal stress UspA family protein
MFTSILVAVDTSEAAQAALKHACELAKLAKAKVTLVTVVDVSKLLAVAGYETPYPVDAIQITRDDSQRTLDDAERACSDAGVVATGSLAEGDAVDEILRTATEMHADLIAIGTHGRKGLSRLFIGSVAEGVLRRADVPVLVVRAPNDLTE